MYAYNGLCDNSSIKVSVRLLLYCKKPKFAKLLIVLIKISYEVMTQESFVAWS